MRAVSALLRIVAGYIAVLMVTTIAHAQSPLKLLSPNGSEELPPGSVHTITWSGTGKTDSVRLEYSTNSGRTWQRIARQVGGTSYNWTVPALNSRHCLLRAVQVKAGSKPYKDSVKFAAWHNRSIAFSPDGENFALGLEDGIVWIYQTDSLKHIKTLTGPGKYCNAIAYSPDGSLLATASVESGVRVWNTTDWSVRYTLPSTPIDAAALSFSRDSRRLFFSSYGVAEMYDMATGAELRFFDDSVRALRSGYFSPDGRFVVTATDRAVSIWDAANASLVQRIDKISPTATMNAVMSHDGRMVAIGQYGKIVLYDIASGDSISAVTWNNLRAPVQIKRFRFSDDDSRYLVSFYYDCGSIVDVATGDEFMRLKEPGQFSDLELSPDGTKLIVVQDVLEAYQFTLLPSDVSDREWSILMGTLSASDLDLRSAAVGAKKDSNVTAFIRNGAKGPLLLSSLTITDGDTDDFEIMESPAPLTLQAGESTDVTFRFKPTRPGLRRAHVKITSPFDTSSVTVIGNGVDTTSAAVAYGAETGSGVAVSAYPNPARSSMTFNVSLPRMAAVHLVVTDQLGTPVAEVADVRLDAGVHELKQDVRDLPSGIYHYQATIGGAIRTGTFVVLH